MMSPTFLRLSLPGPLALLIPLALVLAACSPEAADQPASEPAAHAAAQSPAALGGVDLSQTLRALGTEPFWSVEITSDALVYQGVDRPEQRGAHSGPVVQGTTASWSATTDGGDALEVTLIDTDCSDGMSDRTYPLTARVVIGAETLNGCAARTAAIMDAGESGRIAD